MYIKSHIHFLVSVSSSIHANAVIASDFFWCLTQMSSMMNPRYRNLDESMPNTDSTIRAGKDSDGTNTVGSCGFFMPTSSYGYRCLHYPAPFSWWMPACISLSGTPISSGWYSRIHGVWLSFHTITSCIFRTPMPYRLHRCRIVWSWFVILLVETSGHNRWVSSISIRTLALQAFPCGHIQYISDNQTEISQFGNISICEYRFSFPAVRCRQFLSCSCTSFTDWFTQIRSG